MLEHIGSGEVDAVVVDDEIVAIGHPPPIGFALSEPSSG